ncbi:MAG: YggT family protein [Robiginitomaculum sp.]|nr:YggT family protein [Robiginitomaculum sp.]
MSNAVFDLLLTIIGLYQFVIFAWVVGSWLQMFGIINPRNPIVGNILSVLHGLVDPVVAPIRRVLPSIGGLDLSPIVLLVGLNFIRVWLVSFMNTGSVF